MTDGYACALSLEAERWRLEKRVTGISRGSSDGDLRGEGAGARDARETARRETVASLTKLRDLLSELRRHADDVRVGSPLA